MMRSELNVSYYFLYEMQYKSTLLREGGNGRCHCVEIPSDRLCMSKHRLHKFPSQVGVIVPKYRAVS